MKHLKTIAGIIMFVLILAPSISFARYDMNATATNEAGVKQTKQVEGIRVQSQVMAEGEVVPVATQVQERKMIKSGEVETPVNENDLNQKQMKGVKEDLDEDEVGEGMRAGERKSVQVKDVKNNKEEKQSGNQASDNAVVKRSRVATAVQEMLQLSERNEGVGERIRIIAQNEGNDQTAIEAEMKEVNNRGRLRKFFFGPDYKNISSVEARLQNREVRIEELEQIMDQVPEEDAIKLQEQIEILGQEQAELEKEVLQQRKGFSLFGWFNRMIAS